MIRFKTLENTTGVQLLSALLAVLLWLSVMVERPGQTKLQVPVRVANLPAGLQVSSPLPERVEVTVAGPRILLLLLPYRGTGCEVDLAGAGAGTAVVTPNEGNVQLPDRELKVVRVQPAMLQIALSPTVR